MIEPLFSFHLPTIIPSHYALLAAIVLGLFFAFKEWAPYEECIEKAKRAVEFFLKKILIPLLPLYVLGFLLKIQYEGLFGQLVQQYGSAFALIIAVQTCYLFIMYLFANGFSLAHTVQSIQNIVPSYLTAFSTMSSTATVPVAVVNAEKNTNNKALASMSIPIMANIHMVGDSLSTPILAMVTMMIFKGCLPTFAQYVVFIGYFCMAMLAASGIPGGGIFVVIPALVNHFGFTPDMVSVITMLYFLLDSFGTAANITADGGLVIILNNLLKRLRIIS
jgi:Na+/H+-dicarboxylate symporter